MRSLLVSDELPSEKYGSGQRLLSLQRALSALGECRFLWLHPEPRPPIAPQAHYALPSRVPVQPSRAYWILRQLSFRDFRASPSLRQSVIAIREDFPYDLAVVSFFRSACAAPTGLVPCLLDADSLPQPTGRFSSLLWPLTSALMRRRAHHFENVFIIRPGDRNVLRGAKTLLLPCISATAGPPLIPEDGAKNLLFVGGTRWAPNSEAVEFVTAKVLPALQRAQLNFRLRLVGAGTEAWGGIAGVSAAGFVEDIRAEYQKAALVLCPVWRGGGANVKLAEALQFGCAVVASGHAARGFEGIVVPGVHAAVIDSQHAYAEALIQLLRDPGRVTLLREKARELAVGVLNQNSFNAIVRDAAHAAVARATGRAQAPTGWK